MSLLKHKRWAELVDIKEELSARDWLMGTSGNLAIKVTDDPLEFLVTSNEEGNRKRSENDFLLVDWQGSPVESTEIKPSQETLLHVEIYKKTQAGCSLHVHTVNNNVISEIYGDKGEITFKGHEQIKAFGLFEENEILSIPIIRNYGDIPTLAEAFSNHVHGDKGAVLIRNHGITVWGKDTFEAKKLLEASEFLFQYQIKMFEIKAINHLQIS
jgi:methylthioribulose-1-phosphate dehydratase